MFSSRIFQAALVISILVHGAILMQKPGFHILPRHQEEPKMEVSYFQEKPKEEPPRLKRRERPVKKDPLFNLDARLTMEKRMPPPFSEKKDMLKQAKPPVARISDFSKPSFSGADVIAVKKKIALPQVDMSRIDNPSYISYYQIVREKIRRAAYQNYTYNKTGEVYLSFIVSDKGELKEVRMVQERSVNDTFLQDIALRSIREASPFPAFPKELDYPQLSFNIIISFELE